MYNDNSSSSSFYLLKDDINFDFAKMMYIS